MIFSKSSDSQALNCINISMDAKHAKYIRRWLVVIGLMIFFMVIVGGLTRLTQSGLSMVEWKPIMGIIPPLHESEWMQAFEKYKQYPEYKVLRPTMTLTEFKFIFFWEYFHRVIGRLIGIAFFIPLIIFHLKGWLTRKWKIKLWTGFALGGAQGLMGWYMVKSGLVDVPYVSHFRLAAHLGLAFFIFGYLYWLYLMLKKPLTQSFDSKLFKISMIGFLFLTLQILFGAFVAGLDAGWGYNTFPKMNGSWMPFAFSFQEVIMSKAGVQWLHRVWGTILLLYFFMVWVWTVKQKSTAFIKSLSAWSILIVFQYIVGVLTLIWVVPVWLASFHQVMAFILIAVGLTCVYFARADESTK